jgi:hypothetical protein
LGKSLIKVLKSMSFWDWFFVPLWIMTPFVMIFGAQAVFGDHLLLIILVLVYALGTIPYFMSKRAHEAPNRPPEAPRDVMTLSRLSRRIPLRMLMVDLPGL